ncbi:MAG TPA: DUF4872 domain-containing protein [Deltaproteobacteria bacterium]|nr:DUF4872 domain-containing protein [Deltaproteobacteria bacterium]
MKAEITVSSKPFIHQHAAHCESGVTSALFRDKGVDVSEAMVFGIGSGIFFGHFPFVKWVGLPITTFRSRPRTLFPKVAKRLGGKFFTKKYRNRKKGMAALRSALQESHIVGLTTNIYWLSYFPERFRFQFNGHNIIVLREIEDGFRISDPVLDHPVDCPAEDLERARFAKGPLEPKGFMYYAKTVSDNPDFRRACIEGMKDSCNMMLRIPFPFVGIRGMRYLAKSIVKSPDKLGVKEACRRLANVVRMQEEVGTGGAGFRFMYAAFLQEAAEIFASDELARLSQEMTAIGDIWREFAVVSARIVKNRGQSEDNFAKAGGLMLICAGREEQLFKNLDKVARKLKA